MYLMIENTRITWHNLEIDRVIYISVYKSILVLEYRASSYFIHR